MDTLSAPQLQNALSHLESMMPFPLVLERCIQLLSRPYAGIKEVARWIKMDGVLTARVLQCANAELGPTESPYIQVEAAAEKLGRKTLEEIAFTFYIRLQQSKPSNALSGLWKRSLAHAISAELLSNAAADPDAVEATNAAYLAGLLMDSGKLLAEAAALEISGFDHAELSSAIARSWCLPDEVCDAIRWHHEPDMAADLDLAANLNLAERIVGSIFDHGEEVMSGEMFGSVPADPELFHLLQNNRQGTWETLGEYERVMAAN